MRYKLVIMSICFWFAITNFTYASENEFVKYVYNFDNAQSQLNLDNAVSYLSDDISIQISTCEGTIDKLNLKIFKETYASIAQHAELLSINREVIKIENCDNGLSCTIYSTLSERVVAYSGKYDKTTLSTDITQIMKHGNALKIESIHAKIKCK